MNDEEYEAELIHLSKLFGAQVAENEKLKQALRNISNYLSEFWLSDPDEDWDNLANHLYRAGFNCVRAEHYQQERDKYREQCRHWEQRWKDVERCLRVKDRQKATLDSIAHYLSENWTVAFDHPVLQRALEDAGYDLSEPGEPEPFIHGDSESGAEG